MTEISRKNMYFDLWKQPWIGLEKKTGEIERVGIENTLLAAHEYQGIFDQSPLVIVAIHRLLTAILQDIFAPSSEKELKQLWKMTRIPENVIYEFSSRYGNRFDLFSREAPFFQSSDVSIFPVKGQNIKSAAYLWPDIPSGTEQTHYRHGAQNDKVFCSACVAAGLVCIPAFATSGGAGIKPSINGVPPIYVIPTGENLLETLLFSLTIPGYQPQVRSLKEDMVWWKRSPIIPRSSEVLSVGYLHSLTFQARRVRLYPEPYDGSCSRCGEPISWGVRQMIFDMGECRPKEATAWFDPFAAYKIPHDKSPIPIRPVQGKATWREYSSLFLKMKEENSKQESGNHRDKTLRPSILDQIADLRYGEIGTIHLRAIGLRTDMKAKVFEWVDSGFDVPSVLLKNEDAAHWVDKALIFSQNCASILSSVVRKAFNNGSRKSDRYTQLKAEMMDEYWQGLSLPFRGYVLDISGSEDYQRLYEDWVNSVIRHSIKVFSQTAASIGDEGRQLKLRFQGERLCRSFLYAAKKKELNDE
jgi:CRISPR system Cascade subunit CasA